MSTPSTPSPQPGDDRNLVRADDPAVGPGFETRLAMFWEKNRGIIVAACAAVFLVIVIRGAWAMIQERQAAAVARAYAAAQSDEQLRAFATEHEGEALAGVAHLRLADNAYSAANYPEAIQRYEQARGALERGVLADRAALGAAVARLQAGQTAEARAGLEQLANDTTLLATVRAEAAYHLAALAAAAAEADAVSRWADLVMSIDPGSTWSQRATMLRANAPAPTSPSVGPAGEGDAPAVSFSPGS